MKGVSRRAREKEKKKRERSFGSRKESMNTIDGVECGEEGQE